MRDLLMILMSLFFVSVVMSAQDLTPEQTALKSDIVAFLTDEGLPFSEDSSGDIHFNYFGHDFSLRISRVDKKPFYIVLSESLDASKKLSEPDQYILANGLNKCKAVKVVYKDGQVSFRAELFVENVSQFKSSFRRYMSSFNNLHSDYDEALNENESGAKPVPVVAVDLGLSVKWASCNLGASKPEEYGDYYAWGATEPWYNGSSTSPSSWKKSGGYTWANCPFNGGNSSYNSSYWSSHKSKCVGANGVLLPSLDAAQVKLGGNWRIPTEDEFFELKDNCSWTWTKLNGVDGYKIQSKRPGYTDKWIFLPAAGFRDDANLYDVGNSCCSSSLNTHDPAYAWTLYFDSDGVKTIGCDRRSGQSVRPVTDASVVMSSKDLTPEQQAFRTEVVEFLTGEDLSPAEDSSGDIRFTYFGHDFTLRVSRVDKKPFYIVLSESLDVSKKLSEPDQYILANGLNKCKAVKVVYKDGQVSFRAELFVENVSQFKSSFRRYMSSFNNLHSDYDEALKSFETAVKKVTAPVAGVSLNKTTLSLNAGSSETLVATVAPSTASNKMVTWSSSNTSVATVDGNGNVTAKANGTATITVKTTDGGKTATCAIKVRNPCPAGAVDLGLSVYWASCNLGASKPAEYGSYYQWAGTRGVTVVKSNYLDWSNCPYHTGSSEDTGWTKYVPSAKSSYWSGTGSPDNKTVLDPEDDVAHVKLGGKWRMPTIAEFEELYNNCTSGWTTLNGVRGMKFTSKKNGNCIFLPAAGYLDGGRRHAGSYGYYWSSSLHSYPNYPRILRFYSDYVGTSDFFRCSGLPVRPVSE